MFMTEFGMVYTGPQEVWGLIPEWIDPRTGQKAQEMLDANYQHGGGYRPQDKWDVEIRADGSIAASYPGDPDLFALGYTILGNEIVAIFDFGYVAIIQPDRSFVMARMD